MEKRNNVKRYAFIMVLGMLLNLGFYQIAHVFHLPFWMDNIGTAYVAMILEPTAGLLVAFATNFYQAAVIYDSSSLVYYAVSAMAALCIGIALRKQGVITWKRLAVALVSYFVLATILSTLLTLWRTSGVPDSGWERQFYQSALQWGWPAPLACLLGTAVLKLNDSLLLAVLLPLLYTITPKNLINMQLTNIISWKHPYFHHEDDEMKE